MHSVKFYCESKPRDGEIVQVIFTNRHDDHTEGHLTEYNGSIIMVHSQATTRKRIKNWSKIIPLDTQVAAIIESYDEAKGSGCVSRAYLKDSDENYSNKFVSNGKLFNGIYQICEQLKIDFNNIWQNKINPFISKFELEDDNTLFDVFTSKLDEIDKIFDNQELVAKIKDKFKLICKKEIYKKKIGIIANDGVETTKRLISTSLEDPSMNDYKDYIEIKYYSTPNYMIETNISNEVLDEFINIVKKNSTKIGNIFVKVY